MHTPGPWDSTLQADDAVRVSDAGTNQTEFTLPCGCLAWHDTHPVDGTWEAGINYCRTHAQAPAMLVVLQHIVASEQLNKTLDLEARAVLRMVE